MTNIKSNTPSQMSRVLAALEDDSDGGPDESSMQDARATLLAGAKRKWEQSMGTPGPSNQKQARNGSMDMLPPGLLASTQSSDNRISGSLLTSQQDIRRLFGGGIVKGVPFQVGYDIETPTSRLDIGGHDQIERMAEFVSKSIDNLSAGMLVKDGMKYLGLNDAKNLLPGLEVRLMPHQILASVGEGDAIQRRHHGRRNGSGENGPNDRYHGHHRSRFLPVPDFLYSTSAAPPLRPSPRTGSPVDRTRISARARLEIHGAQL